MSLLDEAMSKCVILNKQTKPDGYGGFTTEWTDGAEFLAAVTFNSSMQARIGEKQGVTSLYTVTVSKGGMPLEYHDVFRRISDGKIFRVTSDSDDEKTPNSATLDMRQCSAEEWELTR